MFIFDHLGVQCSDVDLEGSCKKNENGNSIFPVIHVCLFWCLFVHPFLSLRKKIQIPAVISPAHILFFTPSIFFPFIFLPVSMAEFPVREHAWVAGQVPSLGWTRGNHTMMFLSLSSSLPSLLSKNK